MAVSESQLREVLSPLVRAGPSRIDSFLEDDMEGYIKGVLAFHIEDKVIQYVKSHPNASAQELYRLIPEGSPDQESDDEED